MQHEADIIVISKKWNLALIWLKHYPLDITRKLLTDSSIQSGHWLAHSLRTSSYRNETCSRHDIDEALLTWRYTNITYYLAHSLTLDIIIILSKWNDTCSRHDIGKTLPTWHYTNITNQLAHSPTPEIIISSKWNEICSRCDIVETLLIWRYTNITHLALHKHYSFGVTQTLLIWRYTIITHLTLHKHYSFGVTQTLLIWRYTNIIHSCVFFVLGSIYVPWSYPFLSCIVVWTFDNLEWPIVYNA